MIIAFKISLTFLITMLLCLFSFFVWKENKFPKIDKFTTILAGISVLGTLLSFVIGLLIAIWN